MKLDQYSRQEKMLKKMREIALNNPDSIRIVETSVDADIQIEFYEALQIAGNTTELADVDLLYEKLYDNNLSTEEKKNVIIQLVIWGDVKTYRIIEDYLKDPDKELKTWAYLAYQQARMFLESNLLEESKIFIASGLGGKEHRLRYLVVFSVVKDVFTSAQMDIAKGEIEYTLKKNDGIVENILFEDKYMLTTILIPLSFDIVELIHGVVDEINQYGDFLKQNVFITNEKKLEKHELKVIFDKD